MSEGEARRARRRAWAAWGLVASTACLIVAVVVAAPLLGAGGHDAAARVIYRGFSVVCHQIRERSFQLAGLPLAVCARCFGLYVGTAAGIVLYPLFRRIERRDTPPRAWLIAAALPTTIDFALGLFGIWANTHFSRFVTGALFGAVAAFYIVPGMLDFSRMSWHRWSSGRPPALSSE